MYHSARLTLLNTQLHSDYSTRTMQDVAALLSHRNRADRESVRACVCACGNEKEQTYQCFCKDRSLSFSGLLESNCQKSDSTTNCYRQTVSKVFSTVAGCRSELLHLLMREVRETKSSSLLISHHKSKRQKNRVFCLPHTYNQHDKLVKIPKQHLVCLCLSINAYACKNP